MNLKFTYQQKLKFFPLLFLMAVILVYWIAVSGTVELKKSCTNLRKQLVSAGDAPTQLASLQARLNELNKMKGNIEKEEGTDPLLNFVSINPVPATRLINYQPLHFYTRQPYLIETRIAVFEGNYNSLLKLLFTLEKSYSAGKVVSVKFETETNLKTEKKRLLMTLYIQSISNDKNPVRREKSTSKT
jgi:hypothetical protein